MNVQVEWFATEVMAKLRDVTIAGGVKDKGEPS
jgi:hypothetical protein